MADDRGGDFQPDVSLSGAPSSIPQQENVRVLYIAGIGRSGSTLLCRALGSVEGFVGTGELMRIIGRGIGTGDLCSCGAPVQECGLWGRVWDRLARATPAFDFDELERTRHRVTESPEFLRYFVLSPTDDLARALTEYRRFLAALYRAVRDETGAKVVVDASKNLMFARLLTETPGLDVSVLHLVRDSRGVAHSLGKRQPRPGTTGRAEHFRQFGPLLGSILWSTAHVTTERFEAQAAGFTRMRYEDLVADPGPTLLRALRALYPDESPSTLPHVKRRALELGDDHLIASNPNRSSRGVVELREDLDWRCHMSATRRWVVTALTFPLLFRYGYRTLATPRPAATRVDVAAR